MIVFVHLFNDCSGSPKILCSSISNIKKSTIDVRLYVGSEGSGVLDDVGVPTTRYWYKRGVSRFITLFTFIISQFCLFYRLFRARDLPRNAVIYVNTLLPFGAALFGALTGRPVLYHLHEVTITPAPLRWFLVTVAKHTACQLIYVSDFHRRCMPIYGVPAKTVYNALSEDFVNTAKAAPAYRPGRGGSFRVLMLASLRDYKGVLEFVELARQFADHTQISFHLVANDDGAAIHRYFKDLSLPNNLTVYPRIDDPSSHYAQASLVVNLSRPDQWVETFGLTLIEAMAFGVPVIAPPVGGPVEVVTDGKDGFCLDSRDSVALVECVERMLASPELCLAMSKAARLKSSLFSAEAYGRELDAVIESVAPGVTRR